MIIDKRELTDTELQQQVDRWTVTDGNLSLHALSRRIARAQLQKVLDWIRTETDGIKERSEP